MNRIAMLSTMLTLVAVTGCASKSTGVAPERPQIAYGCPVGNARVGSVEDLIAAKVQTAGDVRDVKVKEIQCTMQNDLLRIDFTLANSAASVRRVAYRFDWIDRNGMKAWNDDSWKPVYLYEESRQTIVGMAPAATAVDFRLVLLDADKKR
jgi:uncharacterized protein YcfL